MHLLLAVSQRYPPGQALLLQQSTVYAAPKQVAGLLHVEQTVPRAQHDPLPQVTAHPLSNVS